MTLSNCCSWYQPRWKKLIELRDNATFAPLAEGREEAHPADQGVTATKWIGNQRRELIRLNEKDDTVREPDGSLRKR
jgi:hypothetical protein